MKGLSNGVGTIKVNNHFSTPISSALFSGWGKVGYPTASAVASAEPLQLCSVSGRDEATGREVIAVVDEPQPVNGVVSARESLTFTKPKSMSHGAAAQVRTPRL